MEVIDALNHLINIKSTIDNRRYHYWAVACFCLVIVACKPAVSTKSEPTNIPLSTVTTTPTNPADPAAPPSVGDPGLLASKQSSNPEVRAIQQTQSKEDFVSSFTVQGNNSIDTKIALLDYVNNGELTDPIKVGEHVIIPPSDFCQLRSCSVVINQEVAMQAQLLIVVTKEMPLIEVARLLNVELATLMHLNPSLVIRDPIPVNTVFALPGEIKN